jgi:16S rRNA (guanine527-N7)-methyltransferase
MDIIRKYFPSLTAEQERQFGMLQELYTLWNNQINVISRKDIEQLYEHHVLHSLAIAKVISFAPGTHILDVGTGGGFPGIPLAIMFPECSFMLVDSIGKKIKVVTEVSTALGLTNIKAQKERVENLDEKFHFIVSRAVTTFPEFYRWIKNSFSFDQFNPLANGILYLKGGDLTTELGGFEASKTLKISDFYEEEFFETKSIVYLPAKVITKRK